MILCTICGKPMVGKERFQRDYFADTRSFMHYACAQERAQAKADETPLSADKERNDDLERLDRSSALREIPPNWDHVQGPAIEDRGGRSVETGDREEDS
jgi:hypothetical protein